MNRVPLPRRVQIIGCLVEGNSIRSTERMTGTHRDTICRLLVEVGDGCAKLMDEQMRELPCRRIEVDEIWAYVGILAVFALFLLLGTALISVAVIGMLTIGAIISAVWRGRSRRMG